MDDVSFVIRGVIRGNLLRHRLSSRVFATGRLLVLFW